jgi:hypothetical protein
MIAASRRRMNVPAGVLEAAVGRYIHRPGRPAHLKRQGRITRQIGHIRSQNADNVLAVQPNGKTALPGVPDRAPGWYPDPAGSGQQRWWDGQAWGGVFSWAVYLPVQPLARSAIAWEFITHPLGRASGRAGGLLSLAALVCSLAGCGAAGVFIGVSVATNGPVGGVAPAVLYAFSIFFPLGGAITSVLRGGVKPLPPRGSLGPGRWRRLRALGGQLRLFRSLPPLAGRALTAAYYLVLAGYIAAIVASLLTLSGSGRLADPWATTWGQRAAALFLGYTCFMIAGTAGERLRRRRAAWSPL